MTTKELFINSIKMVAIDDHGSIPTVLLYDSNTTRIGRDALDATTGSPVVNENFKVELGNIDPRNLYSRRLFATNTGESRSAFHLTNDFFSVLLQKTEDWISARGLTSAKSILVAEPVSLHKDVTSKTWLPNYRDNLRRILSKSFDTIDFLPEPFAVFQYYRYGLRHPLVADQVKHVALIIDFGGGTLDVSVVETTARGDISASGRNSRPLAASSAPVGGFYINERVAERLLFSQVTTREKRNSVSQALKKYHEWRKDAIVELADLRGDYQNFIRNFRALVHNVEQAKIAVCNSINDWELEAEYAVVPGAQVPVPLDPLKEESTFAHARLDAYLFREVFVNDIWKKKLYPEICSALENARKELGGQHVSVVLLSGGSSNIRWLGTLLREDLATKLGDAELVELREDFQEIVSKGLAVECARRFFSEDGDFGAVTYNRLCLLLDPDGAGVEIRPLRSVSEGLPHERNPDGVLLPSASVLRKSFGREITWKVRLSRPPKHTLDYYFLNSSFDPGDVQSRHNIDHTVVTPKGTHFDAQISVSLTVREDGTAAPEFVYSEEAGKKQRVAVKGTPFYLDMTYGCSGKGSEAYFGFDFGSSNSSVSYVDRSGVTVYKERAGNKSWKDLNTLVGTLPYPVAVELASYLSQTRPDQLAKEALSVLESILALAAYGMFQEYRIAKPQNKQSRLFGGFTQRSIGPLWKLVKECTQAAGKRFSIFSPFADFASGSLSTDFDAVVTALAQVKHEKANAGDVDHFRWVQVLGNLTNQVFSECRFGFFQGVTKRPFSSQYTGIFRCANGPHRRFVHALSYEGAVSFYDGETFVYHPDGKRLVPLAPFIFWAPCGTEQRRQGDQCCYIYDSKKTKDAVSYKVSGAASQHEIATGSEADQLLRAICELTDSDAHLDAAEAESMSEPKTSS